MAKGQKRNNREAKKPKAVKAPPPTAGIELFTQGKTSPSAMPKKKS